MGVLREMAEKLGHKVLPLAPYSPELNPIEKVWANIKRYLRTVLSDYARFDDALLSYFDFNWLYAPMVFICMDAEWLRKMISDMAVCFLGCFKFCNICIRAITDMQTENP